MHRFEIFAVEKYHDLEIQVYGSLTVIKNGSDTV